MASKLVHLTATGLAVAGPAWLKSIVLTSAGAAATAAIDDSDDGAADDLMLLKEPANNSSTVWTANDESGVFFATGIHVTLTGTGAVATVEFVGNAA